MQYKNYRKLDSFTKCSAKLYKISNTTKTSQNDLHYNFKLNKTQYKLYKSFGKLHKMQCKTLQSQALQNYRKKKQEKLYKKSHEITLDCESTRKTVFAGLTIFANET